MGFLNGKRALIVGLASNRSIAWGIAKAMQREGAELAFSYPNEKLGARVTKMAKECNSGIVLPCDVSSDEQIENLFVELGKHWDGLDILVHSVAFAPGDQLAGDYLECVTREGFAIAHDISSYSFAALAKAAYPMMKGRNGALLTMSYLGAVQTVPNYNVMGVAKASLEANVRYLAQSLGRKVSGSTRFQPAQFEPWPLQASVTFVKCWMCLRVPRLWAGMSLLRMSVTLRPFCVQTLPPV